MPKGVVELALNVDPQKAKFSLDITGPKFVPDPKHIYVLQYHPLPNYKDEVNFETNANGFLTSVKTNTTDETGGIVVNVAKTLTFFGAFEAAPITAGTEQIVKLEFDPFDDKMCESSRDKDISLVRRCRGVEQQLNAAITTYVQKINNSCEAYVDAQAQKSIATQALEYYKASSNYISLKEPALKSEKNAIVGIKNTESASGDEIIHSLKDQINTIETKISLIDQLIKTNLETFVDKTDKDQVSKASHPSYSAQTLDFQCATAIRGKKLNLPTEEDSQKPWNDIPTATNDWANEKRANLCLLNQAKKEAADKRVTLQGMLDDLTAKMTELAKEQKEQKQICKPYNDWKPGTASPVYIALEGFAAPSPERQVQHDTNPVLPTADCSSGVCYRQKQPYKLVYGINLAGAEGTNTAIIELPNETPLIAIDINRAFFVNKVHNVTFNADGFLSEVEINKPSELLAVSKLPLEVISAVADSLKARVEFTNQQRDLAKREAALLEAQGKLRDARTQLESASIARTQTSLEASPGPNLTPRTSASSFTLPVTVQEE